MVQNAVPDRVIAEIEAMIAGMARNTAAAVDSGQIGQGLV
jgi:hypothetical protein